MEILLGLAIAFVVGIWGVNMLGSVLDFGPWGISLVGTGITLIIWPVAVRGLFKLEHLFEKPVKIAGDAADKVVAVVEKARSTHGERMKATIMKKFPLFCSHHHCNMRMIPVAVNTIESCDKDENLQLGWGGCPQIVCAHCFHNETDPCTNGND